MISQFERSVLQLVQLISAIKFVMLLQDPTQSPMEKRHRLSRFRVSEAFALERFRFPAAPTAVIANGPNGSVWTARVARRFLPSLARRYERLK